MRPVVRPHEVVYDAVPRSVRQAREKVASIAAELGAPREVIDDARLCVSEATSNAVRHAYADGAGDVRLRIEVSGAELRVAVADDGVGLSDFKREGELGHGLRIIDELTRRCAITSVPSRGTEVLMVFGLDGPERP